MNKGSYKIEIDCFIGSMFTDPDLNPMDICTLITFLSSRLSESLRVYIKYSQSCEDVGPSGKFSFEVCNKSMTDIQEILSKSVKCIRDYTETSCEVNVKVLKVIETVVLNRQYLDDGKNHLDMALV